MCLRKGHYVVRRQWARIYVNGSYSKLEIDFGKIGGWELAIHFGCVKKNIHVRLNPSLRYLEHKIRLMAPNCL
jgi:hypothetical protein